MARTLISGLNVLAGLMLVACATIVSGTTQEVSFQSSPEDVVVTLTRRIPDESTTDEWKEESRVLGKTPFTMQLDKEENQTVVFSKEGYKPMKMKLATTLDGWFWGNLVIGGLFGSTTDSMSGAMYEYSPSQYFITLNPEKASTVETATLQGRRDKAREFIVRRFTYLITDLSKGNGEDLRTSFELLKISGEQEGDARRKMRALSEVYTDAAVFADHLTELYLK